MMIILILILILILIIIIIIIIQLSCSRAEPGTACIFCSVQIDDAQNAKTPMRVKSGNKNTGKDGDMGIAPLGTSPGSLFATFRLGLAQITKLDTPRPQSRGLR